MKVKEIMSKDIISIKPDTNVKDALNLLFKLKISGLPVIDAQGGANDLEMEKSARLY